MSTLNHKTSTGAPAGTFRTPTPVEEDQIVALTDHPAVAEARAAGIWPPSRFDVSLHADQVAAVRAALDADLGPSRIKLLPRRWQCGSTPSKLIAVIGIRLTVNDLTANPFRSDFYATLGLPDHLTGTVPAKSPLAKHLHVPEDINLSASDPWIPFGDLSLANPYRLAYFTYLIEWTDDVRDEDVLDLLCSDPEAFDAPGFRRHETHLTMEVTIHCERAGRIVHAVSRTFTLNI